MFSVDKFVQSTFYEQLYFIAFKSILIDKSWQVEVDSQYLIRAKLLNDGYKAYPEIAIMLVNKNSSNVYEHCLTVLKTNEVKGTGALYPIMEHADTLEKANYILQKEPTEVNSYYRQYYVPIHCKPISRSLALSIKCLFLKTIKELNEILDADLMCRPHKSVCIG